MMLSYEEPCFETLVGGRDLRVTSCCYVLRQSASTATLGCLVVVLQNLW